jgi:hypothetical protein
MKIIYIVFSLFAFVVGGGMLFGVAQSVSKAYSAESWPSVDGVIISSKTESASRAKKTGSIALSSSDISYSYFVKRRGKYTGKNIGFSSMGYATTYNKIQEVIAKYPVGKTVKVFYNPNNPSESTLLKKSVNKALPIAFSLILILVFGLPSLLKGIKK